MNLTIFNGSPKRGNSNTAVMIDNFLRGYGRTEGNESTVHNVKRLSDLDQAVAAFGGSSSVLLAFPLYNYSVPAGVKEFIEKLERFKGACGGKKIGFLVQYGFPEAVHARPLEQYLESLARLLSCGYLGTIIKGRCNDLARRPDGKTLSGITEIGARFGKTGLFDRALLDSFSKPETQSFFTRASARLFAAFANKFYWQAQLRKNGALDKSLARPYEPE